MRLKQMTLITSRLNSASTFTRSGVTTHSNHTSSSSTSHNSNLRTSQSTTLPPSDAVVSCIEDRALLFQSPITPRTHLEPLQLVKYASGEHYHFHTDWFTSPAHAAAERGGNRRTSFFVYVRVEEGTFGGGTNFPRVDAPEGEWWCEKGFVDCDGEWEKGVTFQPVERNAVFWGNLVEGEEGVVGGLRRGDERTLHAGLPVVAGGKVGMNIWTREGPVAEGVRVG